MASAPEPVRSAGPAAGVAAGPDRVPVGAAFNRLRRFATMAPLQVLRELDSALHGLDEGEAQARLARYGDNTPPAERSRGPLGHLSRAMVDPFVVVLSLLGVVSAATGDWAGVVVIAVLAVISCGLRVGQEYRAGKAAAALRALTATTTTVIRRACEGAHALAREVPTDQLVPGDVLALAAGDVVAADVRLLRSTGLTISQALLTGESLPVTKRATLTAEPTTPCPETGTGVALFDHPALCLQGATVVGGTGTAVVVATGGDTYFGISNRDLPHRRGQTSFDRGGKAVSWTLIRLMLAAVPVVLALTEFSRDVWLQACLFAVAVAVGLVPEMLPVVVTTALVRAAAVLREQGVVVKRLSAIGNLGAMNVLCIDKTGTLTLDRLAVTCHLDPLGRPDPQPLRYAYLAARYGIEHADPVIPDAVDEALLRQAGRLDLDGDNGFVGLRALSFDATRRRATVALRQTGQWGRELLITKGAVEDVLACCTHARVDGRELPLDAGHRQRLQGLADRLHADGVRVLAVAVKTRPACQRRLTPGDETALTLVGYLGLRDEAKPSARTAYTALTRQGVAIKVLTGDHPLAAARICQDAGIEPGTAVCGHEIDGLDDQTLAGLAQRTTLFARVDAHQKARIVSVLRAAGNTVGYLGDGVNDAPALHAADVGACVEGAVEVAQQSSDVLLVGKDLAALSAAVAAGRHALGNIIKYVKITVSSNVGNVCAVLAASATLPFLPMLPLQILVQNLLFDLSQLSLAFDHTDPEVQRRPRTFHTGDLTRFVLCIGAINTLADLATFTALRHTLADGISPAGQVLFHTGWFVENLLTQVLAVHLLRNRAGRSGWSWAARPVLATTTGVALLSLAVAVTPLGAPLGLRPMPTVYYLWLAAILTAYAAALAVGKRVYQKMFRTWL